MSTINHVKEVLDGSLQLGGRARTFDHSTQLLGALPELDSMAVVTVINAIEERFGITVHDDEINADTFATVGTLVEFVDRKLQS